MSRAKTAALLALPPLIVVFSLLLLLPASLKAQAAPQPSRCLTGLNKAVAPPVVNPGDSTDVTMVVTHTCPAEQRPVDLVFLVDVSNSMNRGGLTDRSGLAIPTRPPSPVDPRPLLGFTDAPDQGGAPADPRFPGVLPLGGSDLRPGAEPSGCGGIGNTGMPGVRLPTPPGPAPPPGPGLDPPGGIGSPGDRSDEELPGGEDLIREAQRWLRDFATRPEIEADMKAGKLRLSVVSFNDRGRGIVSLTDDNRRVVSRLGVLRTGASTTRLEQGMRKAEQTLRQYERGNNFGVEKNRVRVVVIVSDGQFCSRDLAQSIRVLDKKVRVLALAAGRGANQRKLRSLVSDRKYVLMLRNLDVKEMVRIYRDASLPNPIPVFDPVSLTRIKVRETLTDTMELVPGSLNPVPASITGQTIEWVLPLPITPVTVTYKVRPKQTGTFMLATTSRAEWDDTLGRSGAGDFPSVSVQRLP